MKWRWGVSWRGCRRGAWSQTAAYFPHLSAVSSPWGNCSYVWERGSLQLYCSNTVTCSFLYIWSHSKHAYWKLFITSDKRNWYVAHVSTVLRQKSYQVFENISLNLHLLFPTISFSLSCISLCMPLTSVQSKPIYCRPVVWSHSRFTSMCWPAECQPASHQLKRLSDCSFSAYRIWRMTHYLCMLNFSAALISFVNPDKHWTFFFPKSRNLRHLTVKKNPPRYLQ